MMGRGDSGDGSSTLQLLEVGGGTVDTTQERWLRYAWRVVNCTQTHRSECEAAGGARPGAEREPGNELRWPGYLGRNYVEGSGVLCVGHVHRERAGLNEADVTHTEATAGLVEGARSWLSSGRSARADKKYLDSVRNEYEGWLPTWPRWHQHRDVLLGLGMDLTQIAWTNLAKCRVSINDKPAVDRVTTLCQAEFPMAELIEAIRPAAVLVAVLHAGEAGGIVKTWKSPHGNPLVFSWHGYHGTNERGEKQGVWRPRAIRAIKKRVEDLD